MGESMFATVAVLFALAIIGFLIYLGVVHAKKRREGFQRLAARLGFQFADMPGVPPEAIQAGFNLFSRGRSTRVRNLVRGQIDDVHVAAFDYSYITGSGKNSKTHSQTVLLLSRPGLRLPRFTLNPENMLHRIGEMLGFDDIDFSHAPHFSRCYRLSGPDVNAVRQAFGPSVISLFERAEGLSVEGDGAHMLLYQARRHLEPESELEPSIRRAIGFLKAFA